MRLLAVIGSELLGGDERNDWAVLNALVAANGPESIEVRVMALVNGPRKEITVGTPLGRVVPTLPRWNSVPSETYAPAQSARGRLYRALIYLRGLGVRASGDVEGGDAYRAVRREVRDGAYDRVIVLDRDDRSRSLRLLRAGLADRLRRGLPIPVDAPGRRSLSPPVG
jgi:hypothetical protein